MKNRNSSFRLFFLPFKINLKHMNVKRKTKLKIDVWRGGGGEGSCELHWKITSAKLADEKYSISLSLDV